MKRFRNLLLSLAVAFGMFLPTAASPANQVHAEEETAMYRLYNPNSGEHFYTKNSAEKDFDVNAGWRYEGIGWYAPAKSNTPVYRLYNENAGDHFYTKNAAEKDHLVKLGWKYEDIGWYSDDQQRVPLYRQYNPNAKAGSHNYTTSKAENDHLVSLGWRAEDIGWYGIRAGESAPASSSFSLSLVPAYSSSPYAEINGNTPYFTASDLTASSFESYSPLDSLGRCGVANASVGRDLMPTEERGSIGMVKPSGWHTVRYDDLIADKYLYNRCHLIAYELSGENANVQNLITGTRYLNVEGMLPFENKVASYVKSTGNHVRYRSTPVFNGNDLVARGVLIEAQSVEDGGAGIKFCVFCYNVQPGITINYANGDSARSGEQPTAAPSQPAAQTTTYVLNTNSKKFHKPSCSSVSKISAKNKQTYNGNRQDLINQGYQPCKICNP